MTTTDTEITMKSGELLARMKNHPSVLKNILPEHVAIAETFLNENDFPTTRQEDWKYTRTMKLSSETWSNLPFNNSCDINQALISELDTAVIVFTNGVFNAALSNTPEIDGCEINFIDHNPEASKQIVLETAGRTSGDRINFFTAFGKVYCNGGIVIRFLKNRKTNKPIHLIFMSDGDGSVSNTFNTILAEQGSEADIICSYISADNSRTWGNHIFNIDVKSNAVLNIYKIQNEKPNNYSVIEENVNQERDSRFNIVTMTVDGGWIRNNLNIAMSGENSESHLSGFYLPRNKDVVDNHTLVDHRVPHCNSNELYKGILYDNANGVFNGKVYVRQDAQKTNAYQNNANILMSENAQMNTKPELEIYADDVKCSHGTTTGQIDHNALFYLKSRGLDESSAVRLLTAAFINDVLNKVESLPVRNHVTEILISKNLLFV